MSDIEELEETELRERYKRGDYTDTNVIKEVEKQLQKLEKERSFKLACERASSSAALNANKQAKVSTVIALIALAISIANILWQIYRGCR